MERIMCDENVCMARSRFFGTAFAKVVWQAQTKKEKRIKNKKPLAVRVAFLRRAEELFYPSCKHPIFVL